VEGRLNNLLEQDEAQVLELGALVEVKDPLGEHEAYFFDELLVDLHQLDQVFSDHLHVRVHVLDDRIIEGLGTSVLLPVHFCDLNSEVLQVGSEDLLDLLDVDLARLQLYLLTR